MTCMAREKSLKEQFNDEINQYNTKIESYRELAPISKPLIEKYCDYFESVSVTLTQISLTPKDNDKIPPMFFCECLESGILAREVLSHGSYHSYCTINMVLNKC